MKTLMVVSNFVFMAFTCLVMLTDGPATEPAYIALSVLLVAVPIITVIAGLANVGAGVRRAAGICNISVIIFIVWALIDQYPHPAESGFVPYVVVALLTPVLSAIVLLLLGNGGSRRPVPRIGQAAS